MFNMIHWCMIKIYIKCEGFMTNIDAILTRAKNLQFPNFATRSDNVISVESRQQHWCCQIYSIYDLLKQSTTSLANTSSTLISRWILVQIFVILAHNIFNLKFHSGSLKHCSKFEQCFRKRYKIWALFQTNMFARKFKPNKPSNKRPAFRIRNASNCNNATFVSAATFSLL